MRFKSIAVFALAALLVSPAMAQDEAKGKKKGKRGGGSPAMQLIKQLEPVGLTAEQTDKIKEMGKASMTTLAKLKEDAGITPELMKKRTEAQKALKDSGKKGKELAAAVNEKAGLNEAQTKAFGLINQSRMKFQKSVVALLTEEQKGKLPEKMQRLLKSGGKKGEKKKKKAE